MDAEFIETLGLALKGIGWAFLPVLLLPLAVLLTRPNGFASALSAQLISILDGINYRLGELSKWLLIAMVMFIVFSVVGLSIFGLSFTKLDELPIYLHATVIMLGSAATLLAGQHVRVDIFHTRYSPNKKARLDIIGFYLFISPVCLTLLWSSQSFVAQSWIAMEGSAEADGLGGLFLLKTLIPFFALTVLTQGFAIVLRAAMALTGQARPQRPEHIPPLFGHTPKTKADPS